MLTKESIPTTDDEAKEALRLERDELTGKNLVAIFELKRNAGMPLLDAYQYALIAHLQAAGYTFDENGTLLSSPESTS